MKNILVTGGAGFIGSHFIDLLFKNTNCNIVCVDKLTYAGNMKNIEASLKNGLKFYQEDIADFIIEKIINENKIDVVVNFAAQTHVDRSIHNPREFLETDIMGVFNLVQCCIRQDIERFIHISTDEVYGSLLPNSFYSPFCENTYLDPTSPYSASKACADLLLMSYYKTYSFPVIIVRPCNNYGPRQYPEKLIPMAITRLLQNEKIILHGEGREIREWIYVKDCCDAILKVLNFSRVGEIYNIGSGFILKNIDVIRRIILSICGDVDIKDLNFIEKVQNRPGNDLMYLIDSTKIHEELYDGIDSYLKTTFYIGLRETINWYKENLSFWEGLDISSNYHNKDYIR